MELNERFYSNAYTFIELLKTDYSKQNFFNFCKLSTNNLVQLIVCHLQSEIRLKTSQKILINDTGLYTLSGRIPYANVTLRSY